MAYISDLSNELIDMILAHLARPDAFALRASCRMLRDVTWNHCAKTWFSKITICISQDGYKNYDRLIRCPPCVRTSRTHLCINVGSDNSIWGNRSLRHFLTDFPNATSLTFKHPNPRPGVTYKKTGKLDWKEQHQWASEQVLEIFINLLVSLNVSSLRNINFTSSVFSDWNDGLLRLDELAVMARAAPLYRHNFASLVALSISLSTCLHKDYGMEAYGGLPTFVKAFPALEELTLVGTKRPRFPHPARIFRALAEATSGEDRIPRLKLLRLKFFPIEQDPLVQFIASHVKTLCRVSMDHIHILKSLITTNSQIKYTSVLSTWPTFLKMLDEKAFWEAKSWELLHGEPAKAQRLNLQLWERTPEREEMLKDAQDRGRTALALRSLSTIL